MIDYGLSGKVALVTGVSRHIGIGAAIARSLASCGVNVFTTYYRPYDEMMVWGNRQTEAEEIVESLKSQGVKISGQDVS